MRAVLLLAVAGAALTVRRHLRPDQRDVAGAQAAAVTQASGRRPSDWPNLFGPHHDNRIDSAIESVWPESGPLELWRVPIGRGYSSPIVTGERVIVMHRQGDEESTACLDAANGAPRWERRDPTSFVCGSHYTDGPYSTPATDGRRVVTMGAQGRLSCLDFVTGDLIWQRETSSEFQVRPDVFGVGHSPLLWNGLAILNIGGTTAESGVIAFDVDTGAVRWQATDHGPSYATPVPATVHGKDRLFVLTSAGLVMLDPADGTVFWEFPYESRIPDGYNAVTPAVWDDLVLVSVFGTGSACLQVHPDDSYSVLWEDRRNLTSQYNPLLCADGCVYGVHATDKSFRCVDLRSGQVRWRWKSALARSTHVLAGDDILLFGEFGELGVIRADPEQLVERAMTENSVFDGERCFSAPALAGGRLYLRNEKELACFDLRPAAR